MTNAQAVILSYTCGFRPAISAYAIDCGIKVNATVKPANVSWRKVENLY